MPQCFFPLNDPIERFTDSARCSHISKFSWRQAMESQMYSLANENLVCGLKKRGCMIIHPLISYPDDLFTRAL